MSAALLLSACTSHWDMQGHDPKDFYARHPIRNEVEMRTASAIVTFAPAGAWLSPQAIDDLHAGFGEISPSATETVQVFLAPSQMSNAPRRDHLAKVLRGMGFPRQMQRFEPSGGLKANEAQIDITYAAVIPPHCPDWRTSPVTTYSNTTQGNFGCATAVNLGQQVADPRDLVRGRGGNTADAERNAVVIRQYRSGQNVTAGPLESAGGETEGSAPGASATGQ